MVHPPWPGVALNHPLARNPTPLGLRIGFPVPNKPRIRLAALVSALHWRQRSFLRELAVQNEMRGPDSSRRRAVDV